MPYTVVRYTTGTGSNRQSISTIESTDAFCDVLALDFAVRCQIRRQRNLDRTKRVLSFRLFADNHAQVLFFILIYTEQSKLLIWAPVPSRQINARLIWLYNGGVSIWYANERKRKNLTREKMAAASLLSSKRKERNKDRDSIAQEMCLQQTREKRDKKLFFPL